MKRPNTAKQMLIVGLFVMAVAIVAVVTYGFTRHQVAQPGPTATVSTSPSSGNEVTLEGQISCLPAKGDGPHDAICAIGLHASTGSYYALKMNGHDPQYKYSQGGLHVRVKGQLTPEATDGFASDGTITVSDIQTASTP